MRQRYLQGSVARGPRRVSDLLVEFGGGQSKMSHRIGVLRSLGLVECEHRGCEHPYHLTDRVSVERRGHLVVITIGVSDAAQIMLVVSDPRIDLSPRENLVPVIVDVTGSTAVNGAHSAAENGRIADPRSGSHQRTR